MTINQLMENGTSNVADRDTGRYRTSLRARVATVTGIVGVGYTLSWIAGLSIPAPSLGLNPPGAQIVATLAGHGSAVAVQYALTEGLPAAGIAVIAVALASAARQRGATTAARFAMASGLIAAIVSVLQFGLGLALTATSAPGTAHVLLAGISRLDGIKMLALAVLGASAAVMTWLNRWVRYIGVALAVSITVSGLVYLLLLQSLAAAAGPALIMLLVFMTVTGLVLGAPGALGALGAKDR
jgi:hypothetical protein